MSEPFDRESYDSLLEQGLDLQRRHDAILRSRIWRLQLALSHALRSPSALAHLPANLWRIFRSPHVELAIPPLEIPDLAEPLPTDKPLVLALVPWLQVGGAERVVLELIGGLRGELSFAILPATGEGPGDPALLAATPWIFPPPPGGYASRVAGIVRDNPVGCVLISSCPQAYAALPALRDASDARIVDILHNAAPQGSLSASVARDRYIDLHFAVGELQAEALRRAGVAPEKIAVARNGVDCHGRFRPREATPASGDALLLAWAGRLSEEKDPELFLHILARLPAAQGVLIGDGPERFRIESLIRELGLADRVRVTGFSTRVADRLARCDVLVLTSRVEGSPLTILEAMSLGKPVVAADVGGVREALEDGVSGFLIRERSPDAFAAAVRRIAENPSLGKELGVNGRRCVVERFCREEMVDGYRTGFRRLGVLSKPE